MLFVEHLPYIIKAILIIESAQTHTHTHTHISFIEKDCE
jgi:hypothetical protein